MTLLSWLVGHTDWVAAVIALVGIGVAAVVSVVSALASVWIALWIQRRDFLKRTEEYRFEETARQLGERDAWRRHVIERCFDITTQAARIGRDPGLRGSLWPQVNEDTNSMQMLFRADPEPGSKEIGDWFRRKIKELAVPPARERFGSTSSYTDGVTAGIRFELMEWYAGAVAAKDFATK